MTTFTKRLSLSVLTLAIAGCVSYPIEKDLGESTHYTCDDTPLSVFTDEDRAIKINISGTTYPVIQRETVYGIKYESIMGRPNITFWDKGTSAVLEIEGKAYPECQKINNPGSVEIKNYRAIANDPAWHLVIRDGKMMFNSLYGAKIVTAVLPEARITAEGQTYLLRTGTQDMRITIAHKACQDTLTTRYYPDQVRVLFQGKETKGCGNEVSPKDIPDHELTPPTMAEAPTAPQATITEAFVQPTAVQPEPQMKPQPQVKPLAQAQIPTCAPVATPVAAVQKPAPVPLSTYTKKTWVARQIDGKNVLTPSRLTLTFNDEGLYVGQGGCNQFSGTYKIDDKTLSIDPKMVQTERACTPDLTKQEMLFTSILKASKLIEVRNDTLIISTPHRKTLTFTQASNAESLVIMP